MNASQNDQVAAHEEPSSKTGAKSDFMAAEEIRTILVGRQQEEQERILRWVRESIGLTSHGKHKSPPPIHDEAEPDPDEHSAKEDDSLNTGRAKDIRTFVGEKRPSSDVQFAATVAYYHRFVASEKKETITAEDLQEGARHANRSVFGNPGVPLNNAAAQGYLDRSGRGAFKLNAVGENLVAMTLPGTGGESAGRGGVGVKRRPKAKQTSKKSSKKTNARKQ